METFNLFLDFGFTQTSRNQDIFDEGPLNVLVNSAAVCRDRPVLTDGALEFSRKKKKKSLMVF